MGTILAASLSYVGIAAAQSHGVTARYDRFTDRTYVSTTIQLADGVLTGSSWIVMASFSGRSPGQGPVKVRVQFDYSRPAAWGDRADFNNKMQPIFLLDGKTRVVLRGPFEVSRSVVAGVASTTLSGEMLWTDLKLIAMSDGVEVSFVGESVLSRNSVSALREVITCTSRESASVCTSS